MSTERFVCPSISERQVIADNQNRAVIGNFVGEVVERVTVIGTLKDGDKNRDWLLICVLKRCLREKIGRKATKDFVNSDHYTTKVAGAWVGCVSNGIPAAEINVQLETAWERRWFI